MRRREDRLGEHLARAGLLSGAELGELLDAQRVPLPLASLCYVLGIAEEEPLARELARQTGMPAVVLDRSIISLELFRSLTPDLATRHHVLPLAEDARHLLVAAEDPRALTEVFRELEFVRGKTIIPHVALKVTLARTLRACVRASARGDLVHAGVHAERTPTGSSSSSTGSLYIIAELPVAADPAPEVRAAQAVIEDITREVELEQVVDIDPVTAAEAIGADGLTAASMAELVDYTVSLNMPLPVPAREPRGASSEMARTWVRGALAAGRAIEIDLDAIGGPGYVPSREVPPRVLVVDPDADDRVALMDELDQLGYQISGASAGDEALDIITRDPPDAVVVDVMTPEVDGFAVCRAIKKSTRFRRMGVILMVAVVDAGRITEEDVRAAGADDYHEKPVKLDRLRRRLQTMMVARGTDVGAVKASFDRALELYRQGALEDAVDELRRGIAAEPSSAKHHFVLANLLHKGSRAAEAIDEYEATLALKPDYFPALTRVAYLYYKQGFTARAIDTWRRSLPLCPDPALRRNIEVFMRKLISDLPEG